VKKITLIILSFILFQCLTAQITLKQAIELAIENNKDLQVAKEDVLIAEYNLKDTRGGLFPQISLVGGFTHTKTWLPQSIIDTKQEMLDNSIMSLVTGDSTATKEDKILAGALDQMVMSSFPKDGATDNTAFGRIQLEQLLYSGGKLTNGLRVLGKLKDLREKNLEMSTQSTILDVISSYYNLYLARESLNIQRQALENAERHFQRVSNLYNQGLVSEYDKLRAELEVSRLNPQVLDFENMVNLAEENFKRITGLTGEVTLMPYIDQATTTASSLDISLEDALKTAQNNRLEIQLLNLQKDMYQIQYNVERVNFLPNIGLSASFTGSSTQNEFGSEYWAKIASVGVGLQMPLFTGLSNSSRSNRAKHELRRSQHEISNLNELISLETRSTWQTYNQSLKYLEIQEKNLQLAQRALQIAQARFENQSGIQLEVFDAQIQYNAALIALSQAKINIIKDYYALNKSLGKNLNTMIGDI